jgi:stage II sporulation protein GA (sporulation sigma-E factor processing peptidase)
MIYIAYNPKNAKNMCKLLLLFYLASFAIGGCAFALLYFISPKNVTFKDGVLVGMYPIKVTILAGAIGFILIQLSFSINKRQLNRKDLICNAEIVIGDNNIKLKAYIDSGNTLIDPLTNAPVVIVEKSKLAQKIDVESIAKMDMNNKYKIRLIPFKSIGKQNGMLYRFKSR